MFAMATPRSIAASLSKVASEASIRLDSKDTCQNRAFDWITLTHNLRSQPLSLEPTLSSKVLLDKEATCSAVAKFASIANAINI